MDGMVMRDILSLFQGKRVLVTGDTGFKGSWLSLWLHELGADVVGYALPAQRADDHFHLIELDTKIHHVDGDIRDAASVKRVFTEFQPEFLFHMAAQPLVRFSYDEPKLTFDTNVGGLVNILEAVRQTPSLRAVIYVTTDKVYSNREWVWGYRENDELGGRDPYSASKAAAELVFSAYFESFFRQREGFGAASVRAGNVIGGGDWSQDRIVPDSISSLQNSQPILLRNPRSTRPWQHVLEPLFGYMLLATKLYARPGEFSGAWNFGPGPGSIRSVEALARQIVAFWGSGEVRTQAQADGPHEAGLLHLNCDKAHHQLGWYPRWDFDRTIRETVRWYKATSAGSPAIQMTRQQIQDYMEDHHD